jgi:putative flippase GtrA
MNDIERRLREVVPERFEALVSGVRLGQFVSVGFVGLVADNTVLTLLVLYAGFPAESLLTKAVGIETAILVMFLVNEHWTFSAAGEGGLGPLLTRLAKSHAVRIGGVTVQLTVYWLLLNAVAVSLVIAGTDIWFLAASILAIGTALSVNYVFESLFTWEVHRAE